ncbi:MAG: hypothetical protein ACE5LV_00335 [Candidatus Aminicenantales bacterium]
MDDPLRNLNRAVGTAILAAFCLKASPIQEKPRVEPKKPLLQLMEILPSEESTDYVLHQAQFQIHSLPTEHPHPRTSNLSRSLREDIRSGCRLLLSVASDLEPSLSSVAENPQPVERLIRALEQAILSGRRIFIFGTSEGGPTTALIENAVWQPFWKKVQSQKSLWTSLKAILKPGIENRLIAELTESQPFLSLPEPHGKGSAPEPRPEEGDVVIGISESGEAPPVIQVLRRLLERWKSDETFDPGVSRQQLYFVTNNPEGSLLRFERSRWVLEEDGVTKIHLVTGPEAVCADTWLQASTMNLLVLGHAFQAAVDRALRRHLSPKDMKKLGFENPLRVDDLSEQIFPVWKALRENIPGISRIAASESEVLRNAGACVYLAQKALLPTLALASRKAAALRPLLQKNVPSPSRADCVRVWTPAPSGRTFQQVFPSTRAPENPGLKKGDFGLLICFPPEGDRGKQRDSGLFRIPRVFDEAEAQGAMLILSRNPKATKKSLQKHIGEEARTRWEILTIPVQTKNDPFAIIPLLVLKTVLDIQRTAVLARIGGLVGNTLPDFNPQSLQSIDRATSQVQSLVNDTLRRPGWVRASGICEPISYGEANAVLFDTLRESGNIGAVTGWDTVALSVIRILETLRKKQAFAADDAWNILRDRGLARYLDDVAK